MRIHMSVLEANEPCVKELSLAQGFIQARMHVNELIIEKYPVD